MNTVSAAIIILAFSWITVKVGSKLGVPSVVALITAGLLIGNPPLKALLLPGDAGVIIHIGDIGLIALMFLAGLETSGKKLIQEKKDAALVAVSSLILPVVLGTLVFLALGYPLEAAVIVGICAGITAEATKAKVLLELRKLNTRLGSALIGAGIIDDTIGLGLFVFISFLMKQSAGKEELLVVGSIFAFFVGLVLQGAVGKRHGLNGVIKKVLNWSVIPFFFVSTGIHFELSSIAVDPATLIIVVFVAFAGKLAGPLLVKPLADFSWAQLHLAGWAMNSRGALELALALVAFRTGLIHVKLYSGLIVMALVTTLVFPFVVTGMIRRDPSIMD